MLKTNAYELFEKNPLLNTHFPFLSLDINYKTCVPKRMHFQQLHWHDDIQIVYVLKGEVKIQTLNQNIELKENEAIFINKHVLHSILPNDIAHYRSFIFPDAMVRFYKKSPMDQDVQCLLENNSFEFYFIYEHKAIEIIQELNQVVFQQPKQQYYEYKITTLLTHLMYEILTHITLTENSFHHQQHESIQKCISYIHLHYQDNISLEDIASYGNISKGHCGRLFRETLHITPYEYLIDFRIQKSLEYLHNNKHNMTQIAQLVGFSDTSHYIQSFKKRLDMTPKQYQKQILFNDNNS